MNDPGEVGRIREHDIPGFCHTGDCTGPGGISSFTGRNAAEFILRDQGRAIGQVVAT